MFKRLTTLLTVMTLLALLLAACGGPATEGDTNPTTADGGTTAEQPTTAAGDDEQTPAEEPTPAPTSGRTSNYDSASQQITFWVMPNGPQPLENAQARAEEFTQANPDIGIAIELIDWSIAYNQIQTALQGGADACVTQLGTTWVSGFHPIGGLRPYTEEEIGSMGGAEAFVDASWATTGMEGSGEVVAMPWFVDSRALAYRSDILEQIGVTPEEAFKDLQSFEETLQKIKDANLEVTPFAHTGRGDWNVIQNASMFIWNYGGDILTADNSQAAFNSPEAVEAVTFAAGLFGKGLTPPDAPEINTVQAENKMAEGEVFSVVTGPWTVGNVNAPEEAGGWANREVAENVAFVEFPAGPGGQYSFVGGSQLGIFAECAYPEAAVQFVQYLTSPEVQVAYTQIAGFLPALTAAQDNPTFNTPAYEVFKSAAEKGKVPPAIAQWGAIENVMRTALEGVWEDVAASPGQPIDSAAVQARLDPAAQSVNELLQP